MAAEQARSCRKDFTDSSGLGCATQLRCMSVFRKKDWNIWLKWLLLSYSNQFWVWLPALTCISSSSPPLRPPGNFHQFLTGKNNSVELDVGHHMNDCLCVVVCGFYILCACFSEVCLYKPPLRQKQAVWMTTAEKNTKEKPSSLTCRSKNGNTLVRTQHYCARVQMEQVVCFPLWVS